MSEILEDLKSQFAALRKNYMDVDIACSQWRAENGKLREAIKSSISAYEKHTDAREVTDDLPRIFNLLRAAL